MGAGMREIKFRFWDDKVKKYIYHDEIFYTGAIEIHNCGKIILEQFTGLKDKNGKEIYENDIILIDEKNYKMIFEDGCFQLDHYDNGDYYSGGDPLFTDYEKSEKIGNIHENPELKINQSKIS